MTRPYLSIAPGDVLPPVARADLVNDGPARWHALRVAPQREDQAEDWLRRRGVYAFHPVLRRVVVRMGRRSEQQRRYLPGYVFARFPGVAVISRVMACPWITGAICLSGGEWGILDPQDLRAVHAMRATDRKARAAEAEAAELRHQARLDADRIVAQAALEAEALAHDTQAETSTHRTANLEDLNKLREELAGQTGAELDAARQEAKLVREAAENHRLMVLADAERNAAALREQASAESDQVRQAAQQEAAEVRAALAQEHTRTLEALQRNRDEVTAQLAQLSEQARLQSEQFGVDMEQQLLQLNERRNLANSEADQIVADADARGRAMLAEARAAAAKREREAGLAEAEKIAGLNAEIARLSVRHNELQKLLRNLSQMATSSITDLPDDIPTAVHAAVPALDDTAVDAIEVADDDATRVQPAASGGGKRR